jgi:hypothetical protein
MMLSSHQNRWIDYTKEQYQGAYDLFSSLVNQKAIDNTVVENSIIALEDLGFNTLPFSVNFDDNSQDEEEL